MSTHVRSSISYIWHFVFTRHANITTTGHPHATSHDVILGGYRIPSDAIVLADYDSLNHDQREWKNPEVFQPKRFIDEDGSVLKCDHFAPFFLGNVYLFSYFCFHDNYNKYMRKTSSNRMLIKIKKINPYKTRALL